MLRGEIVKQIGDITKINGAMIPAVDVVIGGSPCQDLSIAGKRVGLSGERSGLFTEQIRVIREMIQEHGPDCPRWMVWENVPGALSSNGGKDFKKVLEETVRIAEPGAPDLPETYKKWPNARVLVGSGWSVAWRVHDAQFWGVAQRRRRIALVADFRGQRAGEVLFERKGVSGDSAESRETGERATGGAERCAYPSVARSLTARYDSSPCVDRGQNIVVCFSEQSHGEYKKSDISSTESARQYKSATDLILFQTIVRRITPLEAERLQGLPDGWTDIGEWVDDKGRTRKTTDSARYRAIGNGIALPFWDWLLRRISAEYNRTPTMGSLFDGIGSFPLIWERINGRGTCKWSSEIDPFCVAVTKRRFENG